MSSQLQQWLAGTEPRQSTMKTLTQALFILTLLLTGFVAAAQTKGNAKAPCNTVITVDSFLMQHPAKAKLRTYGPLKDTPMQGLQINSFAFVNLTNKQAEKLRTHIGANAGWFIEYPGSGLQALADTVCYYAPLKLDSLLVIADTILGHGHARLYFVFSTRCSPQLYVDSMLQHTSAFSERELLRFDSVGMNMRPHGHRVNHITINGLNERETKKVRKAMNLNTGRAIAYRTDAYLKYAYLACTATKQRLTSMHVQYDRDTHIGVNIILNFEEGEKKR